MLIPSAGGRQPVATTVFFQTDIKVMRIKQLSKNIFLFIVN